MVALALSLTAPQAETVRKLLEKQTKKKDEEKVSMPCTSAPSLTPIPLQPPAATRSTPLACLHYVSARATASLSIPHGMDFPLTSQLPKW